MSEAEAIRALYADAGSENGTKVFFYDVARLTPRTDEDVAKALPDDFREDFVKKYAVGAEMTIILASDTLSLIRYKAPPGMRVPPHHHGVHQITYVLKGELRYGDQVTSAGMGFFTPARKYSWVAGPEGAEFLEVFAGIPTGTYLS